MSKPKNLLSTGAGMSLEGSFKPQRRLHLASIGPSSPGQVTLVGAGPGDPRLLTLAGLEAIRSADVLVYDRLVSPELLLEAPPGAELIDVGKNPAGRSTPQQAIHRILISAAESGRTVVRLKGGDPFIFGRGAEEVEALRAHGIPVTLVPGISSALAGPAAAGIPLTHRQLARSFAVVTGHLADDSAPNWEALSQVDTLVVLMGVSTAKTTSTSLLAAGKAPDTPVAIVERATLPNQRVLRTTLEQLASEVDRQSVQSPAVLVFGEVVNLLEEGQILSTTHPWSLIEAIEERSAS